MQSDAAINLGIVTAYNDMLSAHQPYAGYPDQIRAVAHQNKATAQVAGGVPAMCDGVTQGEDGMDLSCSVATRSPCLPRLRFRTTCSMPLFVSGFATKSCPG